MSERKKPTPDDIPSPAEIQAGIRQNELKALFDAAFDYNGAKDDYEMEPELADQLDLRMDRNNLYIHHKGTDQYLMLSAYTMPRAFNREITAWITAFTE
ncbi:MAG: hypothetical protein GW762_01165 [Candidatus Pacebacteria bacterium]|nr:hypothetical protein [Candidatus Paceibacterota bacterium]PIR63104.1 MAG: hypothetical protein COU64_06240 [Candidatus Pacebacteria bacterium CG10_big_fil_rev_8_21_14_0_10_40_26]PIZ78490.1 MAG: hypothetical protein COY01_04565 [Candidatus Pacebacteria bacterium CG_4_10_14_0_2_um_filter_40_20]PJA69340.1 MAG: hypothetical protein CO156_00450 [Candidatus Pacebacteria bacterium CG_4_9_14_3_um_filter_40_12]PJC41358.1 MAG: hypothetical protein CO041_04440 [Candidatus Pacebacteria bacterium CG_4_9_